MRLTAAVGHDSKEVSDTIGCDARQIKVHWQNISQPGHFAVPKFLTSEEEPYCRQLQRQRDEAREPDDQEEVCAGQKSEITVDGAAPNISEV